ncbi:uncharacterized protein nobox isoform X2 [Stigmatopora argus]
MDENANQQFDCPSLLCEELETKVSQEKKTSEEDEEQVVREEADGENDGENSRSVPQEEEQDDTKNATRVDHESPKQKKSRRTRTKKTNERPKNKRAQKETVEDKTETVPTSPEGNRALMEPLIPVPSPCDLPDPVLMDCTGLDLDGSPHPIPQVDSPMNPVRPAPAAKRPHSPSLPQSGSPHGLEPLEMEITQVYSTRRSIRYISRGRGQAANLPVPPKLDNVDVCPLPPAPPKKKTRTLYSTDQLEHLEALFQEEHYPDADKRKLIAASVGVTPQRIMVWFQNRRAKWRKVERLGSCKGEPPQTRGRWSPARSHPQSLLPNMQNAASTNMAPVFPGHFGAKMPMLESVPPVPPFSILSTQTQPSFSQLLATSPGQPRVGEPPDFHPRPMLSPPPLRRASLPLLSASAAYNLNIAPPPLYMDDGASVGQRESHTLPMDASSLYDFSDKLDFLAPSNQNNPQLSYPLQTSYGNRPPQVAQQLQTSTNHPPRMAFLNPSSYLQSNPSDDISSSFIAFGPSGNSTGGVAYSSGGHTCVQSHGGGQIIMQPNNSGGVGSYLSYPWPNVYTQPAVQQLAPNYPAGFAGAARDHQVPSSSSSAAGVPPCFQRMYAHGGGGGGSGGGTVLPPVSTLQPSRLRVEGRAAEADTASLNPPSQPNPVCSPSCPVAPSSVKIECDSPCEIHSHFNCDFSAIHF